MTNQREWADGSRLIVSVSMQFEAGGQPDNAESPFPQNMEKGYRDLPAATWYAYGYNEGIPRMLDLWDRLGIKVTSHMVGAAVLNHPELAKEIVARGHEAAGHGMNWSSQYNMSYEDEKKFIKDGADAIKQVTGATAVGYNANWLRLGENTLKILQELGFIYHIDDVSRDEPFVIKVNGHDFAVVPYTLRCNDILLIEGKNFSTDQFVRQVKMEFDQLYLESERRGRRQMSISFHDRIGGTPQMVKAAHEIIDYIQGHKDVSFKRKDEIARMILKPLLLLLLFFFAAGAATSARAQGRPEVPVPKSVTIDKGLSPATAETMKQTALNFYAFWNTGKKEYLDKAVAPGFFDNTLPPGRPQGPTGPLFASENFRKAVPDLSCTVNDVLIAGEKVTVRMQFNGTFSGTFGKLQGNGQKVSFLAIDILHIRDGKVVEDWHLEDNLTLMQQLGVVK